MGAPEQPSLNLSPDIIVSILFKGIDHLHIKNFEDLRMRYHAPEFANRGRVLAAKDYEAYRTEKIDVLRKKIAIKVGDIKLVSKEFIAACKDTNLQKNCYEYLYWTEKNNPSLTSFVKKQKWYGGIPHFSINGECEVCKCRIDYKYTKSKTRADDACKNCHHEPLPCCVCPSCINETPTILKNIPDLDRYIREKLSEDLMIIEAGNYVDQLPFERKFQICLDNISNRFWFDCFDGEERFVLDLQKIVTSIKNNSNSVKKILRVTLNEFRFTSDSLSWTPERVQLIKKNRSHKKVEEISKQHHDGEHRHSGKNEERSSCSSNIFVVTGSSHGKGYRDFKAIINGKLRLRSFYFNSNEIDGLFNCLSSIGLKRGDILVIVRGGGDIDHTSFTAYKSSQSAEAIKALVTLGIKVITGVGHADDLFEFESFASIRGITPTDAAYKLLSYLGERDKK